MKFMRGTAMTGAVVSMGLLVIGILLNDGVWSMAAVAGIVAFPF